MVPVLDSDPLVGRCVNDLADGASEKNYSGEAFSASWAISLDVSAQSLLSLTETNERETKAKTVEACDWFSMFHGVEELSVLLWHLVPSGAPQAQIHTRCSFDSWSLFFFSALFILQLQEWPVRWKIRSTRDAAFLSLGVNCIFLLFPLCLTPFYKRWEKGWWCRGQCPHFCEKLAYSLCYVVLQSSVFLPQNMDMSEMNIYPEIQFEIGSCTISANLNVCVCVCWAVTHASWAIHPVDHLFHELQVYIFATFRITFNSSSGWCGFIYWPKEDFCIHL